MKRSVLRCSAFAACILAAAIAAQAKEATFTAPSGLTATVTNRDVELHWKNNATAPGGNWIEFTTPGDDYTKLDAAWTDVTGYLHPDVAPESKFIYHIKPFFGQPSAEVEIITGKAATNAPQLEEEGPLPDNVTETNTDQKSIHAVATFAAAAPDGLTAKLASPTSVELRWKDHASDEDGYLVELAAAGDKEFKLAALLPPNSTSFKKTQLPSELKCRFRVRAFFYGEPSNVASVNTPPLKSISKPAP